MSDTIDYGSVQVPVKIYERAIESIRLVEGDHWFWQGAKSGKRDIPQIGCRIPSGEEGSKINKVVNVARLIFVAVKGVVPYQVRRDRALCQEKMCVNPDHHYMIMTKPKKPAKGGRSRQHHKIQGKTLPDKREVNFDYPKIY